MTWTEQSVSEMRGLWLEGKSASQVAKVFGHGCTRNMIISKIHRLIKAGDEELQRRVPSAPTATRSGKIAGKAVERIRAARAASRPPRPAQRNLGSHQSQGVVPPTHLVEIEEVGLVTAVEALPHHCRWPIGDPRSDSFRYCGRNRLDVGSYCATHRERGVKATISAAELIRSLRRVA